MMHRLPQAFVFFCVTALFVGALWVEPSSGSTEVFERRGWKSLGRAEEHGVESVRVLLALSIRNRQALQQLVAEVSNPSSPRYGHYLSKEELQQLIGPEPAAVELVQSWLKKAGAWDVEVLASQEYVAATLPLAMAQQAFQVSIHAWQHPAQEKEVRIAATTIPTVPAELKEVVELISGLRDLPLSWLHKRQISKQKLAHSHRSSTAVDSAAPLITDLTASQNHVFITLTPTCAGGSTTVSPLGQLCSDHPPALEGFLVQTRNTVDGSIQTNFLSNLNSSTTTPADSWIDCTSNGRQATTCVLAVPNRPYTTVTVNVTTYLLGVGASGSNTFYDTAILLSDFVTPQLLRTQYNLPLGFYLPTTSNRQAIASFDRQYWSDSDLNLYARQLGIPLPPITTLGFNDFKTPGDEAQLDITWITTMGQNIPTTFFSTFGGYLLEWAANVLNQPGAAFPLVNSISYSDNENDLTQQYGPNWAGRVDEDFQKIAARGGSVVVAAGDAGATNIGHGASSCSVFMPQYPASSAFVTTVAATGLTPSAQNLCGQNAPPYGFIPCTSPLLEVVVAGDNGFVWTTGGGVSNRTARPDWQADVVNQYIQTSTSQGNLPPASLWNQNGRFYPDLTAVGSNLIVMQDGQVTIAAGTSASTPITAGILASLNAALLTHGKPSLGFANPLLYKAFAQAPGAFNDVTVGNNRCGDVLHPPHQLCCPYGWYATVGYDAASGLGSLNFQQLLHFALNYQN